MDHKRSSVINITKDRNIRWRREAELFVLLLILSMLFGCAGQVQSARDTSTPGPQATEPAKTTPARPEYAVGQTIELDDETLTVNKVERNYIPSSSKSISPPSGDEFLLVNVTQTNKGSTPAAYNEFYFKIEDSKGSQRGVSIVPGISEGFYQGGLDPGESVTGNLVFDVPQDDTGLKLLYTPPQGSQKSVAIDL